MRKTLFSMTLSAFALANTADLKPEWRHRGDRRNDTSNNTTTTMTTTPPAASPPSLPPLDLPPLLPLPPPDAPLLLSPPSSKPMECHLLALAPELRNLIYQFCLVDSDPIDIVDTRKVREPALLVTCKQIRKEARGIFWAENTFKADAPYLPHYEQPKLYGFVKGIGKVGAGRISNLQLVCYWYIGQTTDSDAVLPSSWGGPPRSNAQVVKSQRRYTQKLANDLFTLGLKLEAVTFKPGGLFNDQDWERLGVIEKEWKAMIAQQNEQVGTTMPS